MSGAARGALLSTLAVCAALACLAACFRHLTTQFTGEADATQARGGAENAAEDEPVPICPNPAAPRLVLVCKKARRLCYYEYGKQLRACRVALGQAPVGGKEREGDGKTPEGEFYICMKNSASKFHLSLGLSYPSPVDAERGLREGLITREQHDAILAAAREKLRPPWDTPLGGEVCLHGMGATRDWTQGCVALDNGEIEFLFARVALGDPVFVQP